MSESPSSNMISSNKLAILIAILAFAAVLYSRDASLVANNDNVEQQQQQQQQQQQLDLPVSQPASYEKSNKLNRWMLRLVKDNKHFEIPNVPLEEQQHLPEDKITHIDADQRHCSNEIRDQKQCGACYAFSWLAYAEWHFCMQTRGQHRLDLSEQHLIDCGRKARLGGCQAGFLPDTLDYSNLFGFHLESDYPYLARESGQCKKEMGSLRVRIDAKRINYDRQDWEKVLEEQPILVQVNLPDDISSFSRGIHPGTNCDAHRPHGMLLVGHGRQEGRPYWLLRNSMGATWGENGYFRLSRDAPLECMRTGFIAKLKFKTPLIDDEAYEEFYSSLKHQPKLVPIHNKQEIKAKIFSR